MKKHPNYIITAAVCVIAACFAALFFMSLSGANAKAEWNGVYESVSIDGEYNIDGGEFTVLTNGIAIKDGMHTVVIKGHFSRNIEKNQVLMFKLSYLRASLRVNGDELFSYGYEHPSFVKGGGNVWASYTSQGITTADDVEITLDNVYSQDSSAMFEGFLSSIRVGSERGLYMDAFSKSGVNLILGFAFITIGIVCVIIGFGVRIKNKHLRKSAIYFGCIMIFGGLWTMGDYNLFSLFVPYPAFSEVLIIGAGNIMLLFVVMYASVFLSGKYTRSIANILMTSQTIFCAATLIVQLTGLCDLYEFSTVYMGFGSIMLIISDICLLYEAVKLKNERTKWIFVSMSVLVAGFMTDVLRIAADSLEMYEQWFAQGLGLLAFAAVQIIIVIWALNDYMTNMSRIRVIEKEVEQSRVSIMLSQIQPHFLYNALTTIRSLYAEGSPCADDAITSFSKYLRGNMDSLKQKEPIPFERELSHLQNYLEIERLRFGDKLKIAYKISATRFYLPALTIQPLVENAIHYGIMQKKGGGTVTVSTREADDGFYITVEDDGAGFDPMAMQYDGRSHIGIENTRSRVEAMCGGTLEVVSAPRNGAKITIFIPRERKR